MVCLSAGNSATRDVDNGGRLAWGLMALEDTAPSCPLLIPGGGYCTPQVLGWEGGSKRVWKRLSQCLSRSVSAQIVFHCGPLIKQPLTSSVYHMSTCMATVSYSMISWDSHCVLILDLLNEIAYLFQVYLRILRSKNFLCCAAPVSSKSIPNIKHDPPNNLTFFRWLDGNRDALCVWRCILVHLWLFLVIQHRAGWTQ